MYPGSPLLSATKKCSITIIPPLISKRLIVTFDADYDKLVKGKEADFKEDFEKFYVDREKAKGRVVSLTNIKVEKGQLFISLSKAPNIIIFEYRFSELFPW